MITYDEIKAASENLEREYTDEIRPLLLEVVKAFNTMYMPYLNKQTVGLANAHKRKDLVSIPSLLTRTECPSRRTSTRSTTGFLPKSTPESPLFGISCGADTPVSLRFPP